jgi:hypothetical protein
MHIPVVVTDTDIVRTTCQIEAYVIGATRADFVKLCRMLNSCVSRRVLDPDLVSLNEHTLWVRRLRKIVNANRI